MPTGRVPSARLQRDQSKTSRSVFCNRLSPDCHRDTSNPSPHHRQQNRLSGLNPRSPSSSAASSPDTLGSPTAASDDSKSTEGINPYYNLAAAAATAVVAATAGVEKTGVNAEVSCEGSSDNAADAAATTHTKLQIYDKQEEEQQCQTKVEIDINDAPNSGSSGSNGDQQQQQQPCAWREVIAFALPMLATLAADPLASLVDTAFVGHLGAAQLAGVGMAINIFSSITRLFNAPLLAVTTSAVAAAAAERDRDSKGSDTAAATQARARSGTLDKPETLDRTGPARSAISTVRSETLDNAQSHESELFESDQHLIPAAEAGLLKCRDIVIEVDSPVAEADKITTTAVLAECLYRSEGDSIKPAAEAAQDDLSEPLLGSSHSSSNQREHTKLSAAVSAAIILALSFSLVEVLVLAGNCSSLVSLWGAPAGSPLNTPTRQFLLLRGIAAPVTVLLLVMQGVFRGLQDAKTPFYATLACNALNIALEPPFIFNPLNLGVQGSALATALAQTVPLVALLAILQRRYKLRFRGLDMTQLGAMFAPTGFLLLRTVSISAVFATATSLVARAGPLAAAAHQVAFQIWMATSLLADSLAVASQTILARSVAANNLRYARKVAASSITMALLLGCMLSVILGITMHALPGLFTQDKAVLSLARQLMPIVAFTQPINALAFVSDGVLYGAGGFKFASGVMLLCAAPSLGLMFQGQVLDGPQRQHRLGPNQQLWYTLIDDASGLGFRSNRFFSTQAKPYSSRVLQPPTRQYNSTAAGQFGYAESSPTKWTTQFLNELNNYQQNVTASGAFGSPNSGFGVLSSIRQVSVAGVLQGFAAQPSMQGYNSLHSQQHWLGFWGSPGGVYDAAAAKHSSVRNLTDIGGTDISPAAAAASLAVLQGSSSSSSTLPVSSHVPMPVAVYWVWAGMVMLMLMRAATILLPLACRCYPFTCLFTDLRGNRRQERQEDSSDYMQPDLRRHSSLSIRSISSLFAPARMWAWLGRGSFFAAGPAAAAAVGDQTKCSTANLASYKRQKSGGSRFNSGSCDLQDDARKPLLAKAEFHCEEDEVFEHDQAELGSRHNHKLAALVDSKSLLAAKCASVGIPIAKLSEVHSEHAEVDDSLLVVVCGGDGSSSGCSSSSSSLDSSSGSEVLGSSFDEQ